MTIDYSQVDRLQQGDKDLLIRKNTDYGNSNLTRAGLPGIATRLLDKVSRLNTLAQAGAEAQVDESLQDTLRDISNYGILGRMLLDDELNDRPASIYLAGPIDLAPPELATGWRTAAREIFGQYRIATFDPSAAWVGGTISQDTKFAVMKTDFAAILACEMVLAYLPYDVPSLGTIREIEFARSQDKRVVVASPWAETSAFSADLECYSTLWQAFCVLAGIDEQELTQFVSIVFPESTQDEQSSEPEWVRERDKLAEELAKAKDYVRVLEERWELSNDSGDTDSRSDSQPIAHRRVR